jgi:peptidylprolyl isomerase
MSLRPLVLLAVLGLSACSGGDAQTADPPLADYEPSLDAPEDVAEVPADAKKTESGLAYKVLREGDGTESPVAESKVTVHYTGWQTDGTRFDSSREKNRPLERPLNTLIAGWTEGVQLMQKGDHYRFWIPEELAYKGRDPKGMLVFDVELIDFTSPPKAPDDVAAPPADATTTESGLAYKVIEKGPGGKSPASNAFVRVHYEGFKTDGTVFDYSKKRGPDPASFGVKAVIAGWTEGLQLMETGDSYRFWIPEELAYQGKREPKGMLVFNVELIDVSDVPESFDRPADLKTTESGLAWKLLSDPNPEGKQVEGRQPIKANWSVWLENGTVGFDSNFGSDPGLPRRSMGIPGFQEAVSLLHEGERGMFWVPEEMVKKAGPNTPDGDIVFDIELVEVGAMMQRPKLDLKSKMKAQPKGEAEAEPAPAPE